MTTQKFNAGATDYQIKNFYRALVPFGYMDVARAVEHAYNAGHDADWAAEQIEEFMGGVDSNTLNDIDPVYCVMDRILQDARNEIDNLTDFDIQNDVSFDTYGNCMCSNWQYSDKDKEALIEALAFVDVNIEDLEQGTQYFLDSCEIGQNHIDEAKTKIKLD